MEENAFREVLALLRKSIDPLNREEINVSDWDELFQEMKTQAVQAIPTEVLERIIPENEKERLSKIAVMHYSNINRQLFAQSQLVNLFNDNQISFVILKGLAVAGYYPHPEYRTLGDIDIAVLHDQYDRARRIMLENEYQEIENPYEKHDVFQKDGIAFELHKYFASANNIEKATIIEDLIQDGIRDPVICELFGYRFPTLPAAANGIMLLEHMSQHLEGGIGLRHMMDWMLYAAHELDDDRWENGFRQLAEKAGVQRLAEVSAKLCVNYLGLKGITWCSGVDDDICARLLEHVEQRGNFGSKETTANKKAQKLLSTYKSAFYWLRYLQRTGLKIPFIQRHRYLRPFAWLVRGCVLLKQYHQAGNSLLMMKKENAKAREIELFMDDLGVRRLSRGHTFWNGKKFIIKN